MELEFGEMMTFHKIFTLGLSASQNQKAAASLPAKGYALQTFDDRIDFLAIGRGSAATINASALTQEAYEILIFFYEETVNDLYETVFGLVSLS